MQNATALGKCMLHESEGGTDICEGDYVIEVRGEPDQDGQQRRLALIVIEADGTHHLKMYNNKDESQLFCWHKYGSSSGVAVCCIRSRHAYRGDLVSEEVNSESQKVRVSS